MFLGTMGHLKKKYAIHQKNFGHREKCFGTITPKPHAGTLNDENEN